MPRLSKSIIKQACHPNEQGKITRWICKYKTNDNPKFWYYCIAFGSTEEIATKFFRDEHPDIKKFKLKKVC